MCNQNRLTNVNYLWHKFGYTWVSMQNTCTCMQKRCVKIILHVFECPLKNVSLLCVHTLSHWNTLVLSVSHKCSPICCQTWSSFVHCIFLFLSSFELKTSILVKIDWWGPWFITKLHETKVRQHFQPLVSNALLPVFCDRPLIHEQAIFTIWTRKNCFTTQKTFTADFYTHSKAQTVIHSF